MAAKRMPRKPVAKAPVRKVTKTVPDNSESVDIKEYTKMYGGATRFDPAYDSRPNKGRSRRRGYARVRNSVGGAARYGSSVVDRRSTAPHGIIKQGDIKKSTRMGEAARSGRRTTKRTAPRRGTR